MKIARFLYQNKSYYGAADGGEFYIIDGGIYTEYRVTDTAIKAEEVTLLPPCLPSKIVCVGLNYHAHRLEMNDFADTFPKLFLKPSTAVIAHGERIICPDGVDRVDFEAEFAAVIKKTAKSVPKGSAREYILGYTCLNDVTARELQAQDGQWTRAKSFDTFAPIGPVIATDANPDKLGLRLLLNGEIKQQSSADQLIWGIDFLVEEISKIMTLLPGDIISTGTPGGCGKMEIGDKVEVAADGIGTLTNYFTGSGRNADESAARHQGRAAERSL
ncbi:MAG: fumarylacetoacetate hydrolase family protein [Clostridiales bacterium]|nr:fumarylacetoacetate hydrolase family protein [Clostridiales bacterium]